MTSITPYIYALKDMVSLLMKLLYVTMVNKEPICFPKKKEKKKQRSQKRKRNEESGSYQNPLEFEG